MVFSCNWDLDVFVKFWSSSVLLFFLPLLNCFVFPSTFSCRYFGRILLHTELKESLMRRKRELSRLKRARKRRKRRKTRKTKRMRRRRKMKKMKMKKKMMMMNKLVLAQFFFLSIKHLTPLYTTHSF